MKLSENFKYPNFINLLWQEKTPKQKAKLLVVFLITLQILAINPLFFRAQNLDVFLRVLSTSFNYFI